MIIRATSKLLKVSGIKPVKNLNEDIETLPGEWYATILKTGHVGKMCTLFFHNRTKISIICPTKSINIAIKLLPERLDKYLKRHGFESLTARFNMTSESHIFSTNSKSTIGYMNQISANVEWHLCKSEKFENIDFNHIEDVHFDFMFSKEGKPSKYEKPIDILKHILMSDKL